MHYQIFVMKVDSLGNEIWHEEYGNPISTNEFGTSILMVTHDLELAQHMERILVLEDGVLRDS